MKWQYIGLLIVGMLIFSGCGQKAPTPAAPATPPPEEVLEPGVLSPGQIDSSMINQAVKVKGKVLLVHQDPGGLAIRLSGGGGEVGVRIEADTWESLTEEEKAQFEVGKTATAEGMLVLTGGELFVVLGVASAATGFGPSAGETTFVVTVPENTSLADAVCVELFDENRDRLGQLEMERIDSNVWQTSIPAGIEVVGYRYNRDHWGFVAGEEFTPDSKDTLRWARDLTADTEIRDTVEKWRWCLKHPMGGISQTDNSIFLRSTQL